METGNLLQDPKITGGRSDAITPIVRRAGGIFRRDPYQRLWTAWRRVTRAIGRLQAQLILTLVYFIILAPFGLIVRFFLDPLGLRERPAWHPPSAGEESAQRLEWARRQF